MNGRCSPLNPQDVTVRVPDAEVQPLISLREAIRLLGISRPQAYRLIADGKFPVKVVRIGGLIRVSTAELRRFTGLDEAVGQ